MIYNSTSTYNEIGVIYNQGAVNATAYPSGVSASSLIGTAIATGDASISIIGLSSTASVGTASAIGNAIVSITGVSATASVGDVVVSVGISVMAYPAGVETSASVGQVIATGTAVISITGIEASSSIGTSSTYGNANVSALGVGAVSSVGSVSISADWFTFLNGVSATASVGTVIAVGMARGKVTEIEANINIDIIIADISILTLDADCIAPRIITN